MTEEDLRRFQDKWSPEIDEPDYGSTVQDQPEETPEQTDQTPDVKALRKKYRKQ